MTFSEMLAKQLAPFMKAHGFQRKRNRFYKVQNDLAFALDVCCYGGPVYLECYMWPLYRYSDYRNYSYGTRLNNVASGLGLGLCKGAEEDEIAQWLIRVERFIEEQVIPFWSNISVPEALKDYLESHTDVCHRLFMCPKPHMQLCLLNTYLYLGEYSRVVSFADEIRDDLNSAVERGEWLPSFRDHLFTEIQRIEDAAKDAETAAAFCKETITKMRKCFP